MLGKAGGVDVNHVVFHLVLLCDAVLLEPTAVVIC